MEYALASVFACIGIVILIILAGIAAAFLKRRKNRSRLDTLFADREPLTVEEFHERHIASRGIPFFVSAGVLKALEAELQVHLSRLKADDDFAGNLLFLRNALEDPNTLRTLEDVFEITISESDVQKMGTTIGDIIDLIWMTLRKNEKMKNKLELHHGQRIYKGDIS